MNLPAYFFERDYTFEVLAANDSGFGPTNPFSTLSVAPAWWLRWWEVSRFLF